MCPKKGDSEKLLLVEKRYKYNFYIIRKPHLQRFHWFIIFFKKIDYVNYVNEHRALILFSTFQKERSFEGGAHLSRGAH